jgi:hypothetical protein
MDCRIKSGNDETFAPVMPGHSRSKNGVASLAYAPGIHVLAAAMKDVDGRVKPGHDEGQSIGRQRIFVSEIRFMPFGHRRRRKLNGPRIRNAQFSVAYGRASAQFHCCLTRFPHPLTRIPSRPP